MACWLIASSFASSDCVWQRFSSKSCINSSSSAFFGWPERSSSSTLKSLELLFTRTFYCTTQSFRLKLSKSFFELSWHFSSAGTRKGGSASNVAFRMTWLSLLFFGSIRSTDSYYTSFWSLRVALQKDYREKRIQIWIGCKSTWCCKCFEAFFDWSICKILSSDWSIKSFKNL